MKQRRESEKENVKKIGFLRRGDPKKVLLGGGVSFQALSANPKGGQGFVPKEFLPLQSHGRTRKFYPQNPGFYSWNGLG